MINKEYQQHHITSPPFRRIQKRLIKVLLFFVGRGMESASKHDIDIQKEVESFPNGFTLTMQISPDIDSIHFQKKHNKLIYIKNKNTLSDITIYFKNIESAFLVLTARIGTPQAYAEHRISVKGNVTHAVIFTRCMTLLQSYLFIKLINKRIMKRVPPMTLRKHIIRLYIYLIGIPFKR